MLDDSRWRSAHLKWALALACLIETINFDVNESLHFSYEPGDA
jgi:hypothetical protein